MINDLISAQYSLSALIPGMSSAPDSTKPPAGIMSLMEAMARQSPASASEIASAYGVPSADSAALLRAQLFALNAQLSAPLTSSRPVAKTYAAVQSSTASTALGLSEFA